MIPSVCRTVVVLALAGAVAACERSGGDAPAPPPVPAAPAAPVAPAPAPPAGDAADPVAALAAMNAATATADATAAYLERHFADACRQGDERLTFERVCRHYPAAVDEDPSPWPDFALGIDEGRIVSAVLTAPTQSLGAAWDCSPAARFEGMRVCFVPSVPADARARWSAEWTAYFESGD